MADQNQQPQQEGGAPPQPPQEQPPEPPLTRREAVQLYLELNKNTTQVTSACIILAVTMVVSVPYAIKVYSDLAHEEMRQLAIEKEWKHKHMDKILALAGQGEKSLTKDKAVATLQDNSQLIISLLNALKTEQAVEKKEEPKTSWWELSWKVLMSIGAMSAPLRYIWNVIVKKWSPKRARDEVQRQFIEEQRNRRPIAPPLQRRAPRVNPNLDHDSGEDGH